MALEVTRKAALQMFGLGALGTVLAACSTNTSDGAASADATDKLQAIKDAGKIRIGMEGTFKPFGYHDESGDLVGFEKEIADLIAKDLGVKAEYIETPWDSLIAGVDADRYDIVINNVSPTEERKQKYDFSVPYAVSEGRVGVLKDSELQSIDDLAGKSAAQSETSNFRTLVEERGATIIPVTGFDEAIEQVLSGRADLTGNDFVTFQAYMEEHPDANLRLLDGTLGDGAEAAILMEKGAEELKAAIDESLTKHLENGNLKAIYEKYVKADLSPKA
ncbi:transporter substrate-binding domain-containing protein [Rothia sp. ZJ1223]|uniref:transporter substrate-binding domain-containing protein n=1 Tax=Rothia sp. ZJ1223 TaxID=2811098 RepID=UPI0019598148|nr:transporter substrate-binding domain-containing protein [Rothia sp. ZJ1223]MBM7052147.1 transporter substrate-binding domain-containing protein [Rothia sp. ZJ1223]